MREETEQAGCPSSILSPPSSAPAVLCVALNLRHLGHSSSCTRPLAGSEIGQPRKQLPLLPLETGSKSKEVARATPYFSVENSFRLLYLPGFS